MVQSLQHMHLNGFVTFGLQMNTVEKLTCFEYYSEATCDIQSCDILKESKQVQICANKP